MNGKRQAVVLSGGGAYGAFEVGVMKALAEGKSPATGRTVLDPEIITGTSAGAFNAAVLLSQENPDPTAAVAHLEKIWLEDIASSSQKPDNGVYRFRADPRYYLDPVFVATHPVRPFVDLAEDTSFFARDWFRRAMHFLVASESLERRSLELVDLSTLISTEPFRELVHEKVKLGSLRKTGKILRIAATNWETGELSIYKNDDMTEEKGRLAVLASAAIPGIFPPVKIDGAPHVDGGVLMNTPLKPAIDAGADTLHIIFLNPDVRKIPLERIPNTLDVMERLMTIANAGRLDLDIANAAAINRGIEVIDEIDAREGSTRENSIRFLRAARRIREGLERGSPYRQLTIHRYHPRHDLGGIFGMLNFSRERIERMIEDGYRDAIEHDCEARGCILAAPGAGEAAGRALLSPSES